MFARDHHIRTNYSETDQMGYVYYGQYCKYYEIGRAEAIRSLGISYRYLESELNVKMPVASVESRFVAPAVYDELLTIRTILRELPTKLCCFHHEIYNESMSLIHKGTVKLFFVDWAEQKRISAPEYLVEKLKPFFVD